MTMLLCPEPERLADFHSEAIRKDGRRTSTSRCRARFIRRHTLN
jgi:hypothetical protein